MSSRTTPPLRGTPPQEGNDAQNSPPLEGWQAQPDGVVPRLRFPEFRKAGEWTEKPLAEVCNVLQGYGFPEVLQGRGEGKYPFCKVSDISRAVAERGGLLVEAANYVGDDDLLKLRAKPIPKGATVFAKIGEALRLNRRAYVQKECLIDNNATGLKAIDGVADDYFVYLLSQLIDLNKHCGGAVPSVNKTTLEEIEVVVPGPDEQKRIAESLSSLDELITAETQKLDALKTHKKGLMQQLFPCAGEIVPRLRFPEFREAGEWEEKAVGDVFRVTRGEVLAMPRVKDAPSADFPYPVYSSQTKNSGLAGYYSEYLYEDAITWTTDGANAGEVNFRPGKFYCTNVCGVLLNSQGCANNFVAALLNSVTRKYVSYVGNPKLMNGVMSEIVIPFPSLPEQQRIADLLSSLDDLIAAQSQKIDALKTHKKGLMQQLFPVLDEVSA